MADEVMDEVEPLVEADSKPESKPESIPDSKPDDVKAEVAEETPTWPEDWREKAAAGDEKKLARLSRYASPQALADALIAAQNKLSSKLSGPGKDATAEQLKEYRDSLGIPETADKYDLKELNVKDVDKPLLEAFLKRAHETNQTQAQVAASIQGYQELVQKTVENRASKDAEIQKASEDALRAEWGKDFRRNVTIINSLLESQPSGFKDRVLNGRLADGTPIGSDPDMLRWLLAVELERNPQSTIVPGAGANMAQTVEDEISKIEKMMRDNRTAYNRDEKVQARYRELIDAKIALEEKGRK